MAQVKTTFLARDGKEFATELEADAHDLAGQLGEKIDAYISEAGLQKAQAGLLRKHIAGYLVFTERNEPRSLHP